MSIKVKAVWVGGVQVNGLVKKRLSKRNMQSVKIRHSDIAYFIFERKLEFSVSQLFRQDKGQRIKVDYSS